MDVSFDRNTRKIRNPQTRIFSPNGTATPAPALEDATMPVRPQPGREAKASQRVRTFVRLTTSSKILILLSVFAVAATALVALFGAAEYAQIISDTAAVNTEIETYNEQISQIRKSQSSMNDFATIYETCRQRGMTMNWYHGDAVGTAPAATNAPETPAATGASETPEPSNGD